MKNFQRLAAGIDVMQLLHAIQRHPELWDQFSLRTTFQNSPHREVSDIWLRFNDVAKHESNQAAIMDDQESIWYPPASILYQARPLIFQLMHRVEAERLGRVLITKLAPGREIKPHADSGEHAAYYERYHIVLQGLPGSIFRCGDETVQMLTGECWHFQNAIEHHIVNNSAEDRIHMIVDLRVST